MKQFLSLGLKTFLFLMIAASVAAKVPQKIFPRSLLGQPPTLNETVWYLTAYGYRTGSIQGVDEHSIRVKEDITDRIVTVDPSILYRATLWTTDIKPGKKIRHPHNHRKGYVFGFRTNPKGEILALVFMKRNKLRRLAKKRKPIFRGGMGKNYANYGSPVVFNLGPRS